MRGWAGSVPEISVFRLESWWAGWRFCLMNTSAWLPGWKWDEFWWPAWHRLALLAVCVFHIISIPFSCSNTALRVAIAMVGAKVIIFVFCQVCFVSQILHHNSHPGSLAFFRLGNRAEISHNEPKAKLVLVTGPARSTALTWRGPNKYDCHDSNAQTTQ